jgi:hypothetical protein
MAIRPTYLLRRAEERTVLENAKQELQAAVADNEAAVSLHPHLRLDHGATWKVQEVADAGARVDGFPFRRCHVAILPAFQRPAWA